MPGPADSRLARSTTASITYARDSRPCQENPGADRCGARSQVAANYQIARLIQQRGEPGSADRRDGCKGVRCAWISKQVRDDHSSL